MAGDRFQGKVTSVLRGWGFYTYKVVDARQEFGEQDFKPLYKDKLGRMLYIRVGSGKLNTPEGGRFDMVAERDGISAHIELKNDARSFSFNDFQQNKRDWIEMVAPFNLNLFIFLILGTQPSNYNRDKYPHARRAWLIPINEYFRVEELIKPIQNSIPMIAGKGYNLTLQENQWDAVHLFAPWELPYITGGWELPEAHPFARLFATLPQQKQEAA